MWKREGGGAAVADRILLLPFPLLLIYIYYSSFSS